MERKSIREFTPEETMDTAAVNYILAQSDGFRSGYAQAISDLIDNIIDYWARGDDKPQESVLHTLVDLGVELGKRKRNVEKSLETAKEMGYEKRCLWTFRDEAEPLLERTVNLFVREESGKEDRCERTEECGPYSED